MSQTRTSIILIGLLSAFSLVTFDLYQPSLPYITHSFGTTHNLGQLTLSIYLFVFGFTQLIWGPMLDHFGRRRLLPTSLIIAMVGSLVCALAPNITVLIIGRALQGFSLCCAHIIAYSSSRDFEDPLQRAKVLSYVSMIVSASPIIAPVLGSIIFTYYGWQANFVLMAAIALVLLLQCRKGLYESPFWQAPTKAFHVKDVVSAYKAILPIANLWHGAMIMMFSFAAVMITIINSSYLIIDRLGFSPLVYGLIFIINGVNIIIGNYVGIWLRERFSMQATIYLGNWLIILGGFAMLLTFKFYSFSLFALSFALLCNLGISVTAPPTMSLVLGDFKENASIASAFISTIRMFGSAALAIVVGYLLMNHIEALPIGLIGTGFGALFFSRQFNKQADESDDSELDGAEVTG